MFWLGLFCGLALAVLAFLAVAAVSLAFSDGSWFNEGTRP